MREGTGEKTDESRAVRVRRIRIPAPGGRITALALSPAGEVQGAPGVVWMHGGGYPSEVHAFDLLRPDNWLSREAIRRFDAAFLRARERYFAPQAGQKER